MKLLKTMRGQVDLITLLVVLLFVGFFGLLPTWHYSHSWGYGPSGLIGLILVLLVLRILKII